MCLLVPVDAGHADTSDELLSVAAARPEDFDSGRIWVAFEVVALVVAFGAVLIALALFLSDVSVAVEPGGVPTGREYHVVQGLDGADLTIVDCAPPLGWLQGDRDPFCRTRPSPRSVPSFSSAAWR